MTADQSDFFLLVSRRWPFEEVGSFNAKMRLTFLFLPLLNCPSHLSFYLSPPCSVPCVSHAGTLVWGSILSFPSSSALNYLLFGERPRSLRLFVKSYRGPDGTPPHCALVGLARQGYLRPFAHLLSCSHPYLLFGSTCSFLVGAPLYQFLPGDPNFSSV